MSEKIKVVLLEPGKLARTAEINASLAGMQKVVGGLIEPFYPFEEQVCIVCNEESKINGMRPNRSVKNDDGAMVDFIFGPAFICDCRGENLDSLSDEQIDRYGKMFRYLVQVKSNLAPMGSTILFEVADKGVNFLDELELSAEDAFSASAPRMGRPNAREEAATDFIRSLLAGGRRLASDCEAKLEAAGFKKSTYKKSKKKAGVRSVKDGFLWYWTLPEVEKPIENGQEVTDGTTCLFD